MYGIFRIGGDGMVVGWGWVGLDRWKIERSVHLY
jgi:hypothetical protein